MKKSIKVSDLINALTHYSLELTEFPLEPMFGDGESEVFGFADDYKRKLYINRDKPNYYRRRAVVHEILHAVHYLRGDFDNMEDEEVEDVIESETTMLMRRYYGSDGNDI